MNARSSLLITILGMLAYALAVYELMVYTNFVWDDVFAPLLLGIYAAFRLYRIIYYRSGQPRTQLPIAHGDVVVEMNEYERRYFIDAIRMDYGIIAMLGLMPFALFLQKIPLLIVVAISLVIVVFSWAVLRHWIRTYKGFLTSNEVPFGWLPIALRRLRAGEQPECFASVPSYGDRLAKKVLYYGFAGLGVTIVLFFVLLFLV